MNFTSPVKTSMTSANSALYHMLGGGGGGGGGVSVFLNDSSPHTCFGSPVPPPPAHDCPAMLLASTDKGVSSSRGSSVKGVTLFNGQNQFAPTRSPATADGSAQSSSSTSTSQFKTPSKYQDRFIPARTADSISKTLFDLKDEAMIEESSQTSAIGGGQPSNNTITPSNGEGLSSSGFGGAFGSPPLPLSFMGMSPLSMPSFLVPSHVVIGGGGTISTPSTITSSLFSTPGKKVHLSQQDENTKTYSDFVQKELFGGGRSGGNDSILKFHWDSKQAAQVGFSPLPHHHSMMPQSPFNLKGSSCATTDDTKKDEKRKIAKCPFKVLDAPGLQDDFYIDLLDWSSKNEIGVGLGKAIFIWHAGTGNVTKLCESPIVQPQSSSSNNDSSDPTQPPNQQSFYTSLKWSPNGSMMAIGNQSGKVELWDVAAQRIVRTFCQQTERIGSIDFNNNNVFAAGSKDKSILIQDIRDPAVLRMALGHKQEVCQVRWSPDQQYLASGGNDNTVYIWNFSQATRQSDLSSSSSASSSSTRMIPYQRNAEHKAAVRALAWNPHQYGILLSGGGSRDQSIKVWNVNTNSLQHSLEVGSQVCKLHFSPDQNEFVAAHGFEYNRITVWKYPTMQQLAELEGHQSRVLFMSLSPDAQNIVTGAGDETLKLWKVFTGKPPSNRTSLLAQSDLR